MRIIRATTLLTTSLALSLALHAGGCRADAEMEADPLAYIEHGYSLHAAETVGADDRIQFGLFALDVPGFALDNHDFSVRYIHGMTLKFDHFLGGTTQGLFVGIDANDSTARYRLDATGSTAYRDEFSIGPRLGYRFEYGAHFYITPWATLSYLTRKEDITLDGKTYREPRVSLFPTVHFGWRF